MGVTFLGVTSFFTICFWAFLVGLWFATPFFRKQAKRFGNLRKALRVAYGEVRDPGKSVILVIFQKAACGICLFLISCLSKNMFYFFLFFFIYVLHFISAILTARCSSNTCGVISGCRSSSQHYKSSTGVKVYWSPGRVLQRSRAYV